MRLFFLKLGGSLITDKTRPFTARQEKLDDLAQQVAASGWQDGEFRLVLGHGSGSFGHAAAARHGTRDGVDSPEGWHGFAEVWYAAASLNRIVMQSLNAAGLPAVCFPPSAAVTTDGGRITAWDLKPLQAALASGILPVVYGDVAFDSRRGGTIVSTEDLFEYLAFRLQPKRLLLAGLEEGVWRDFPARTCLMKEVTPQNIEALVPGLKGANGADVTGGMAGKVRQMLGLVEAVPGLQVTIFSGEKPGAILEALTASPPGTLVHN